MRRSQRPVDAAFAFYRLKFSFANAFSLLAMATDAAAAVVSAAAAVVTSACGGACYLACTLYSFGL